MKKRISGVILSKFDKNVLILSLLLEMLERPREYTKTGVYSRDLYNGRCTISRDVVSSLLQCLVEVVGTNYECTTNYQHFRIGSLLVCLHVHRFYAISTLCR